MMARMMKAASVLQHGPASSLMIREMPIPVPDLGKKQMLVQVKAAGVNPVDTYIRSGTNNYTATFPHIPGRDGAGVVVSEDPDGNFEVGQRVYFSSCLTGSSAEFTICQSSNTFPLPTNCSFEEGACLGVPYFTAHRALFGKANAKAGQKVLIHGATGGVGLATVQFAQAAGLIVYGSSGSDAGDTLLIEQGISAQYVLNHRDDNHMNPYMSSTGTPSESTSQAKGFDIIIEMLANENLALDIKALANGGTVAVVGNRGNVEVCPRDLMKVDGSITGVALGNVKPHELLQISQALHPLLVGSILKPVVRKVYALDQITNAHEDVLRPGALGNIVIGIE